MKVFNILIDDVIGAGDSFFGSSSGITSKYIREQITEAKAQKAKEILLVINSPGGDVYEGYAIYNILSGLDITVNTYVNGLCASIATLIACAGEKIESAEASQWMMHPPSTGAEGTADEIVKRVEQLKQIEDKMAAVYAERMGKPIEAGYALMRDGDKFRTPEEMRGLGFIDAVVKPIAAFSTHKIMGKDNAVVAKIKSAFNSAVKALEDLGGSDAKAAIFKLADGNSSLYIKQEELQVGQQIFTDEAYTTHATEGEHALSDGRIVVVDAAGVIVEIRELEASAEEQLKAEITALKAENATLKQEKEQLAAEITTAKAGLAKANTVVAHLKSQVYSEFPKLKVNIPDETEHVHGTTMKTVADQLKRELNIE